MIELRALGTAEIRSDFAVITPSQQIAFATAVYLIMERGTKVSRTQLASLLWEKAPRRIRAHRLRQTLFHLKKLGVKVVTSREAVQIPNVDAYVDVDTLTTLRSSPSEWPTVLEFLPGYDPEISEGFQRWLDSTRDSVHAALTRVMLTALAQARDAGRWTELDRVAVHCLKLDPYNETALLARAEGLAMRGQKATALSLLDTFIQEITPKNPTLALPATLLRKRVAQHVARNSVIGFIAGEPDCVGREAETAILTQLLNDACDGHGQGCVVNGEPGIGKTRLASELGKFAQLQGVNVERIACKRSDVDQPLAAFISLVPRLRELPGSLGVSQQSLSWLKRLTEFDTSGATQTIPDDSGTVYTNVRSAVFDLIDAVSEERCLVLLIDDIHWIDRASATLFGSILEWVAAKKVFLLFTSRQPNTAVQDSTPPHRLCIVNLRPLGDRESLAIVNGITRNSGEKYKTQDFEWLVRTGEGNPYFLQELAKHWIETGQRRELPPSVAGVLDERISRLTSEARQLLQACAVLGDESNLERIELLLEYPPHQLLSALQEVSAAGMLRSIAPGGAQATLQVRHDLLAIEVLKGLTAPSLAFLHRRAGLVLERDLFGTSISTSQLRTCAFHWYQSGDSGRAFDLAVKCASHLIEIGLAVDAATALEGALAFCQGIEQRLEVLKKIVNAQVMASESEALLKTIGRIRAIQDPGTAADHHDDLEMIEFEASRKVLDELQPLFMRTLKCVYNPELPVSHRVGVAVVALKLATSLPDLPELQRIYDAIKPLLSADEVAPRTRYEVQVVYNTMCGDLTEAVRLAKERVAFERAGGTAVQLANAMTDLAFVLRLTGPAEEILTVLFEAYEIATSKKLAAAARDYAERIAAFLVYTRRFGMHEWIARAREPDGETPHPSVAFSMYSSIARAALLENRVEDAERIISEKFSWDWLRHRRGWTAAALALRIRVQLARRVSASELAPDIAQLRTLYGCTAALGGQDYEVAALCAGLIYVGSSSDARDLLTDYLSNKRRDLTLYSPELAEACDTLMNHGNAVQCYTETATEV